MSCVQESRWDTGNHGLMRMGVRNREAGMEPKCSGWKERLGLGLFIYSFVPICTVELLAFLPIPAGQAVTYGALFIASGEAALLGAVALLGKPFIQAMKDRIQGLLFRRKGPGAPQAISRVRHRVGVALFLLSFLPYLAAEGMLLFGHPAEPDRQTLLRLLLGGDALFIVSLFVLGGEFWARLKRLFEWPGPETVQG